MSQNEAVAHDSTALKTVSFIILNYNSAADTIELANELIAMNLTNVNILVVDNQSTDDSLHQLRSKLTSGAEVIETGFNGGYAYGNNVGIKRAAELNSDFVMIMNSDVRVEQSTFDRLRAYMSAHPKCAIASPALKIPDRPNDYGRKVYLGRVHFSTLVKPDAIDKPINVDSIIGACFMVQMGAIKQVGMIPEPYFLNFEETEWCLKFKRADFQVQCIPYLFALHKPHGSIGKVSGIQSYFMKRNLVLFNKRMDTRGQYVWFLIKLLPFSVLMSLKHRSIMPLVAQVDGMTGHNRYSHN
ncbi:glycosyltransferase family 2 protein [Lacticaseibacillus porcinae]|uniref:glycosyltransferase family 2 protein n=1 Tax=Lacticaseibacillus porcinae TaxID=1123687 RepID=UPI000F7A3468|nr:glycosyltransferase family 2 protein [Lacticaseibacillus porcinae]